ncbi:hypothetical protein [Erythrobacter sp. R86502]|uniref:hypothetical protein n=1 Tax=Erythrobacter sp. R86502 TaxID=3093846 RepID=UPI0036D3216C
MNAERIAAAVARIEAATARIDTAAHDLGRGTGGSVDARGANGSSRVVELVNVHEKLREQVAESLRELDDILARLED